MSKAVMWLLAWNHMFVYPPNPLSKPTFNYSSAFNSNFISVCVYIMIQPKCVRREGEDRRRELNTKDNIVMDLRGCGMMWAQRRYTYSPGLIHRAHVLTSLWDWILPQMSVISLLYFWLLRQVGEDQIHSCEDTQIYCVWFEKLEQYSIFSPIWTI